MNNIPKTIVSVFSIIFFSAALPACSRSPHCNDKNVKDTVINVILQKNLQNKKTDYDRMVKLLNLEIKDVRIITEDSKSKRCDCTANLSYTSLDEPTRKVQCDFEKGCNKGFINFHIDMSYYIDGLNRVNPDAIEFKESMDSKYGPITLVKCVPDPNNYDVDCDKFGYNKILGWVSETYSGPINDVELKKLGRKENTKSIDFSVQKTIDKGDLMVSLSYKDANLYAPVIYFKESDPTLDFK